MSEVGKYGGVSILLLHFLAYAGLVYDLKTASPNIIHGHMKKHGDQTGQKMLAENEKRRKIEMICTMYSKIID